MRKYNLICTAFRPRFETQNGLGHDPVVGILDKFYIPAGAETRIR
jgi:hypothetical protein